MLSLSRRIALVALMCLPSLATAQSSVTPPVNLVQLVSAASVEGNPVPPAQTLTVATSGNYTVTLTDLTTPAALQSLQLSIATSTQSVLVLSAAGSKSAMLQAGVIYTVQVLAVAASASFGSFDVQVAPEAGGTATCQFGGIATCTYEDAVGPPSTTLTGTSTYSTQVSISQTQAGTYALTLADDAFPVPLSSVELIAVPHGVPNPVPVSWLPTTGSATTTPGPGTYTASLAAGIYDLFVVAMANGSPQAGLYSVQLTGGASPYTPLAMTQPVGLLAPPTSIAVPKAENVSLLVTDLAYPTALSSLQGLVSQGAAVLTQFTGSMAGAAAFSAASGSAQLYVWAVPSAQGAYGAYSYDASSTLLDVALPVVDSSHLGYSYSTAIGSAGTYKLTTGDFQQPVALGSLQVVAAQKAVSLATGGIGATSIAAEVGSLNFVVFPTLAAAGDDSLYGMTLTQQPSGTIAYQVTQGVGADFIATSVTLAPGNYLVEATDLGFPAKLNILDVIITQGQGVAGQLLGAESLILSVSTSGTYVVNVLAQAGSNQSYGQYGLSLAGAPAPTVTLTAQPTSVTSGLKSTLAWSSTNATSCSATGGVSGGTWGGNVPASGTQQTDALAQSTTFSLSCTGPGGTTSAMVQVTVTVATSGGGGGGAFDGETLLALLSLAALEIGRRQRMRAGSLASTMFH